MENFFSRRRFLQIQAALAAIGAAPLLRAGTKSPSIAAGIGTDYYDKLGVVKIINAAGVFTTYTGSTMPREVQRSSLSCWVPGLRALRALRPG